MSELLSTDLYKLVQGRHGRFLANPLDIYIGRSLIEYGEFSEGECTLLTKILRPGAVAIEAGASLQQVRDHARHRSVETTMAYVHKRDRLADSAADFIRLDDSSTSEGNER